MEKMHRAVWLSYMMAVAICLSSAFNIDTTSPLVYTKQDFLENQVLKIWSGKDKGISVSAPRQINGSDHVCGSNQKQTHKCFIIPEVTTANKTAPVRQFGLSITKDTALSQITVCGPCVANGSFENSYLNSVCNMSSDHLQQYSSSRPVSEDLTKNKMDLVFLFDGSASMTEEEFNKNKDFIVDIMNGFTNTSIKFAAVQFSSHCRKVFDFNDYEAGSALTNLMRETHLRTLTNTHRALTYVLDEMLENPAAGASPDAIKVLVLITDGDPSDTDRHGIIQRYDDKNIIRLVIGVKYAELDKIRHIVSEPKDENTFKIANYDGLTRILRKIQDKIEDSKVAEEMTQSGFSAVFYKETLILGSVRTNSWRRSLQEIQAETDMDSSYLGYSTSVGQRSKARLYFTGAPRFNHTGRVVLLRHDGKNWTTTQTINGEQIGSYFGAELCSVDVDADGDTDFLLVGAPQFYQPLEKSEGQIYIYTLTHEMQLKREMTVPAVTMGRFGSTITSLGDLNGDGLRDVAVGAPLEDGNRGAVYIYLGDRERGIRSTFSQRIMGQKVKPGLRFFGWAIDGKMNSKEDKLPHILVGSQGMAVVLRSKPVFDVSALVFSQPTNINTEGIDSESNTDELLPLVNLSVCFKIVQITKSRAGATPPGLNISYTLTVDPTSQTPRGVFSQTDQEARKLTSSSELREGDTCFTHPIYMTKFVQDTLSTLKITLHFSQVDGESDGAVLNIDSKQQIDVEVPFGNNG